MLYVVCCGVYYVLVLSMYKLSLLCVNVIIASILVIVSGHGVMCVILVGRYSCEGLYHSTGPQASGGVARRHALGDAQHM